LNWEKGSKLFFNISFIIILINKCATCWSIFEIDLIQLSWKVVVHVLVSEFASW
jgi:hypothetical protein